MLRLMKRISKARKSFNEKNYYSSPGRNVFYDIAKKYFPEDNNCIVVDIGSGDGSFADMTEISKKYKNYYLLEKNKSSLSFLRGKYKNVIEYSIPDKMPFNDHSVTFVHCSHVIEHLDINELYEFLKEISRVTEVGAIVVVSAPLFWDRFYEDLSHVRPYGPRVIEKYLCKPAGNPTRDSASSDFEVIELKYRYHRYVIGQEYGSTILVLDLMFAMIRRMINYVGFVRYCRNGYTMVLKKTNKNVS